MLKDEVSIESDSFVKNFQIGFQKRGSRLAQEQSSITLRMVPLRMVPETSRIGPRGLDPEDWEP